MRICSKCKSTENEFYSGEHSCCVTGSCGECIRGLLCVRCNVALGYLEEYMEKDLLQVAWNYTQSYYWQLDGSDQRN